MPRRRNFSPWSMDRRSICCPPLNYTGLAKVLNLRLRCISPRHPPQITEVRRNQVSREFTKFAELQLSATFQDSPISLTPHRKFHIPRRCSVFGISGSDPDFSLCGLSAHSQRDCESNFTRILRFKHCTPDSEFRDPDQYRTSCEPVLRV